MDKKDLQFIQAQIGYNFQNSDLLQQAFVRRSYAKEYGGEDRGIRIYRRQSTGPYCGETAGRKIRLLYQ